MAGIQPSLLEFLSELAENNNREWFEVQKTRYKKEEVIFKDFGNTVLEGLQKVDKIEKMKLYRIYKDVRFSKDKTPYKTNRTISFSREGEALRGSYYLHIAPGDSFLGGGFFAPNPADLLRIRKEFEMDDQEIRDIMNDKAFSKAYGNEFVPHDQVKTAPKGFSKEHPAIDLLKNKSFFFQQKFTDAQVQSDNFHKEVLKSYKLLRPFFDYMSDVLTTDFNGVSLLEK